jgi:hypothetical protein
MCGRKELSMCYADGALVKEVGGEKNLHLHLVV